MIRAALLGLATLAALPAAAQTLDPILEEDRRRALEERTNALGGFTGGGGAPDPGPAQPRGGPCFTVNTLTVTGAEALPAAEIAALTAPFVPTCLQGADIQAIMRAIDGAYADRGLITTRTYIPPQNLQSGTLTLEVIEGRVEDVLLVDAEAQDDSPRGARQLATAFPGAKGGLFQLRDFEQGLDQMNRLASVDATLRLVPGDAPGGSFVVVQRVQDDPVRGYVRIDNQGSDSTGRNRLSFDLEWDDLLGANDAWTFGFAGTENTNALSLDASLPYGYWTFDAALSYSEYLTPLSDTAELFGTSRTLRLGANRVIARDQTSKTEAFATLALRRSERDINAVPLTPQRLTTLALGVKHLELTPAARHSLDASLTVGLPAFGADRNGTGKDTPRAQFTKLNAGWQRQAGVESLGTWVSDLRAQWSPHVLYGAEQLALGSSASVRGYTATEAVGDSGLYWRNDLYMDLEALWPDASPGTQLTAFLDAGLTRDHARDVTEKAAGLGFGLTLYTGPTTLTATIAAPLIEDGAFGLGQPVVELRLDVKVF